MLGTFNQEGHWFLSDEDRKCIHKAFELFYRNRLSYEELRINKHNWDYSFKPFISETSLLLAEQYREKALIEVADMLDKNKINMKIPNNGKISHN